MSGEPAAPHALGHQVELIAEGPQQWPVGLVPVVSTRVDRGDGGQDPTGVANILVQEPVEHRRGFVRGRFGRDEALQDGQTEFSIPVPDVPVEDLVARDGPGGGRPDEAHHEQRGRRSCAIEHVGHRRQYGVSESTDRTRGGSGRASVSEGCERGCQREQIGGLDRVERGGTDGHVLVLQESGGRGAVGQSSTSSALAARNRTAPSVEPAPARTSSASRPRADSSPEAASRASADIRMSGRGSPASPWSRWR